MRSLIIECVLIAMFISSGYGQTVCNSLCNTCESTDPTKCTSCNTGYYFDSTAKSCTQCTQTNPNSCKACASAVSTCTECKLKYYLDNGQCKSCSGGCKKCSSDTVCTECSTGYYLKNSACDTCRMPNCKKCSSATTCTECDSGNYLTTDGKCKRCGDNCGICDADKCLVCYSGSYLPYEGAKYCVSCDNNIKHCASCTSSDKCTSCAIGYYLSDGKCEACSSKDANCAYCKSDGTCIGCVGGYFVSSGKCSACGTGCKSCTSNTVCTECYGDYTGTTTCSEIANLKCTTAGQCYVTDSSSCAACPVENCIKASGSSCNICAHGYYKYYSNVDQYCVKCDEDSYSDYAVCRGTCTKDDYFQTEGSCSTCTDYCTKCTNGVCAECLTGFYLNTVDADTTSCEPCPAFCNTCELKDGKPSCTKCADGYGSSDGGCSFSEYLLTGFALLFSLLILA